MSVPLVGCPRCFFGSRPAGSHCVGRARRAGGVEGAVEAEEGRQRGPPRKDAVEDAERYGAAVRGPTSASERRSRAPCGGPGRAARDAARAARDAARALERRRGAAPLLAASSGRSSCTPKHGSQSESGWVWTSFRCSIRGRVRVGAARAGPGRADDAALGATSSEGSSRVRGRPRRGRRPPHRCR